MIALGVLIFVVIFQIAKASEYVSVLKGEDKTRKQNNKINAFMLIGFYPRPLKRLHTHWPLQSER